MKKAEGRLKEEENRVELYLHNSTMQPVEFAPSHLYSRVRSNWFCSRCVVVRTSQLVSCCENMLVEAHKDLLVDEFQNLLSNEKVDGA
jgi:hypothetical protein